MSERPTILAGLIGWPVSHSRSPAMHQAAAAALNVPLTYIALPVRPENVATAVRGLPALGFRGVNVTIPHKQAVIPYLDALDPAAAALGAVNTIVFDEANGAKGYNTDWTGFFDDLMAAGVAYGVNPLAGPALVLGAGGSARAVVYALGKSGCSVHVLARRPSAARQLIADLAPHLPDAHLEAANLADIVAVTGRLAPALVVHCTPLGMAPDIDRSPWPADLPWPPGAFLYDLVYTPRRTRLMTQAEAGGGTAVNGLGMLVRQGATAFALWTGETPDPDVMAAALNDM